MTTKNLSTSRWIKLYTIIIFSLIFSFSKNISAQDGKLDKLEQVFSLIDQYYADSVDNEHLYESAIVATLQELDPHSVYIKRKDLENANQRLKGGFDGIGIQFNLYNDTLVIIRVYKDSPADKAGLFPGDKILEINGDTVSGRGISNSEVLDKMTGTKGSKVELKIFDLQKGKTKDLKIKRKRIKIDCLDAAYMIDNETAYLKLNKFSNTSSTDLVNAVKDLKKDHELKRFILDLRSNGGGYLNKAIEISDQFLSDTSTIVYTEGKKLSKRIYHAKNQGVFEEGELYIWVNERSASASEIVAGAIQDWERGVIVGRRTYGKGLVQRQFILRDSSAIRLTIAHYYTPSGRSIQKPYQIENSEYLNEINNREKNGEFLSNDTSYRVDSLKFYTLINHRPVYGGGGIHPDIFIAKDTSRVYQFRDKLIKNNYFLLSAIEYANKNRKELYRSFEEGGQYIAGYNVDENAKQYLHHLLELDEDLVSDKELLNEELILNYYKATIAEVLYGIETYYKLINRDTPYLKETLIHANSSLSENDQ